MTRYVLLAIDAPDDVPEGDELFTLIPNDERTAVALVVQGGAPDVLLQAAGRCTAAELHRARLHQLPREHRRVGQREYEAFLTAGGALTN